MKNRTTFPYSPAWWQSCVSWPDEPDKVLVGREGGVLLDYERDGRGRRHFRTVIQPGLREGCEFAGQDLESPRFPLVRNRFASGDVGAEWELFAAAPDGQWDMPPALVRQGGEEIVTGWDAPKVPRVRRDFVADEGCPPEFRDAAWGADGAAITYELRTEPGGTCHFAAGFAEGEHTAAGQRLLEISADGAEAVRLDPADQFGPGRPGVVMVSARDTDNDGIVRLSVRAGAGSPDRNAFLNALWAFRAAPPDAEAILRGDAEAAAFADCGRENLHRRRFLARLRLHNSSDAPATRTPVLRVWTLERAFLRGGALRVGHATRVSASAPFAGLRRDGEAWEAELAPVSIPPGGTAEIVFSFARHGHEGGAPEAAEFDAAEREAGGRWSALPLPLGVIKIPDARVQALIDASVRNIYQARDIKNGQPAFHVGPTCYRQLWIVDGAFLLETAALLGRADEARAGLDYILGFQEADGGFQLKARYWKETGIVLWTVARHAILTADREWLRSVWPQVVRAADFIVRLRTFEDAGTPGSPVHRLAPYGDIDGGISNMNPDEKLPEFSNAYWLLTGLKAAADAADWLGETAQAGAWRAEFDDYFATFRKAAAGLIRCDAHGNEYLPVRVGANDSPQKGQWAFCHAVHPGGVFDPDDPFVRGMLAMLEATKVEGLVFDTGWMTDGLWTYFASFVGHARLWRGDAAGALADLEAMADHASPMFVWREEQKPAGCGDEEVGDMPHNWASAEFVRLAFHLVALERRDELHLFEGVPPRWLRAGDAVEVRGAGTAFGPLTASLRREGETVTVEVAPLERPCAAIVVHRDAWAPGAEPLRFDAGKPICFSEQFLQSLDPPSA